MSRLKWWPGGIGEWSAWSTEDGKFAPATCRILKTHRGYQLELRSLKTCEDVVSLYLNHQQFTFEDAQFFAELLIAQQLPLEENPEIDLAIVEQRMRARSAQPTRCKFLHAFPAGAGDDAMCQCGRVTKGWLKQKAS